MCTLLLVPEEPMRTLPGLALAKATSSFMLFGGNCGIRDDDERRVAEFADRGEILDRIGHILAQQDVEDAPLIGHQQRVAVRLGLCHQLRADAASGAATILHDDLLPPGLGELLPEQAGDEVGGSAGRKRHDHSNDFCRIALDGGLAQCRDSAASENAERREALECATK